MSTNTPSSENLIFDVESLNLPQRPASAGELDRLRSHATQSAQRFQTRNFRDYVDIVDVGVAENLPALKNEYRFQNGPTQYHHEVKNGRLVSYNPVAPMWNPDGTNSPRKLTIPELFNQGQNTPNTVWFNAPNGAPDPYAQLLHNLAQVDTDFQLNNLSDPAVRLHREYAVAKLVSFENFADITKAFGLTIPASAIPVFGGKFMVNGGYVTNDFSAGLGNLGQQDPNRFAMPISGYAAAGSNPSSGRTSFEDGSMLWVGKNGQPLARLSGLDSQAVLNPLAVFYSLRKKQAVDNLLASRGAPAGSVPIIYGRNNLDPSNILSAAQKTSQTLERQAMDQAFPVVRKELKEDTVAQFQKAKAEFGAKGIGDYVVVHGYRTADGREVMFEDGPQNVAALPDRSPLGVDNSAVTRDMAAVKKYMSDYLYGDAGANALSPAEYLKQRYLNGSNGSDVATQQSSVQNGSVKQLISSLSTQFPDRTQLIQLLQAAVRELDRMPQVYVDPNINRPEPIERELTMPRANRLSSGPFWNSKAGSWNWKTAV